MPRAIRAAGGANAKGLTIHMAFQVYLKDRRLYGEYDDAHSFKILDGGVLQITRADGTSHYLSALLWETIDEIPAPSVYETEDVLVV